MLRLRNIEKVLVGGQKRYFGQEKQQGSGKVPHIDNIRKAWDKWSLKYAKDIEPYSFPSQVTIMNELRPQPTDTIVEAACGSGYYGAYHCMAKPQSQKYTMMDLSPEMIKLAKRRVAMSLKQGKLYNDVESLAHLDDKEIDELFNGLGIEALSQNCEVLSQFHSKSLDIYLGGLFLHLVPDPAVILKEAYRVLKDGGKIGFSVFGDPQNSLYFSLFDEMVKKHGHIEFRSKFYLNDDRKLRSLVEAAGFKNIRLMRQDLSFGIDSSDSSLEHFTMPSNQAILRQFDQATIEKMKVDLKNQFATTLSHQVIGIQNVLVVATK